MFNGEVRMPRGNLGSFKEWRGKFLLFVATSISCAIVTEMVIRFVLPVSPSIYQPDPTLLHKLIPNSRKVFKHKKENGGEEIPIAINSLGFRGPELSKVPGIKRIIVYGDSFVEGEFSALAKTFAKQLEAKINTGSSGPIEVVNAGVVAYGPDQISLKMDKELDKLHPDLVILAIFPGNDFGDLLRNKIYRLDSNNKLQVNDYFLGDSLRSTLVKAAAGVNIEYFRTMAVASEAYRNLSHSIMNFIDPDSYFETTLRFSREAYEDVALRHNYEVTNLFGDYYAADVALKPNDASSIYAIKLMENVIRKINLSVVSRKIPLILLIIPHPIDVCRQRHLQVNQSKYKEYKRSGLTDIVENIAKRQEIPYLNLFSYFNELEADNLYFEIEDHWNDLGQSVAADLTAKLIRSNQVF